MIRVCFVFVQPEWLFRASLCVRQVLKMKQRALFAPGVFLTLDLTVCGLDIMAGRDIIVKLLGISVSQHLLALTLKTDL